MRTPSTASTAPSGGSFPFTDVAESRWSYPYIREMYEAGVIDGMTPTTFEPAGNVTRAQFVKMLALLQSADVSAYASGPFTDVPGDAWYARYVNWAAANGIVNGTSATTFDPSGQITREQLAAILYRYTAKYAPDATGNAASLAAYPDAGSVSAYARDAMAWAVGNGLIKGLPHDKTDYLEPGGSTTRAQVATILMRYKQATA